MVKKYSRFIIINSLVILFHLLVKAEDSLRSVTDFEASLQPAERALMEQNESMVYMTPEFIETIKQLSLTSPAIKNLVDHVIMGYRIAPFNEVKEALSSALNNSFITENSYKILKQYEQALISGDALVRAEELDTRRKRNGKFCALFVQGCASINNLTVRCNENVLGDLTVGGTISASNFSFTGSSGCTGTATFPGFSSCGNIIFNSDSTPLNAQGSLEQKLNLVRATISLGIPGIALIPTTPNPGAALNVGIAIPATATITSGVGMSVGAISGTAFSSGITNVTPVGGTLSYYFVVDLQIPINFDNVYSQLPSITQGVQTLFPAINPAGTSIVDDNSYSTVTTEISNVTSTGSTLNILFNVMAQGTSYVDAANNASIAINNIISNPTTSNGLSINLIVNGPVV